MKPKEKQINIYTLGGKYIFTLDSLADVCTVFECDSHPIVNAIKTGKPYQNYQFRIYRNENDISPAEQYFYEVKTTWYLKNRNGETVDSDTDANALASYYGITADKLEDAYINKTFLFRKYRVDKKVTIRTNEKNEFL